MFTPGALGREDQCVIAADSGDEVPRPALLETRDRNCFVMGAPAYEARSEAHTLHTQDSDVGTTVCWRRGHPPCLAPERALLCELAFGESDGARALCGVRGAGPTALRRVATRSWPWGRMAVAEEGGRPPAPRAEPQGRCVLSRRTVARPAAAGCLSGMRGAVPTLPRGPASQPWPSPCRPTGQDVLE